MRKYTHAKLLEMDEMKTFLIIIYAISNNNPPASNKSRRILDGGAECAKNKPGTILYLI